MTFGETLRQLRKEKGLTQLELGNMFSLGESTISLYEKDKREPDFNTIINFADLFNVSIDYLLGRTKIKDVNEAKTIYTGKEVFDKVPEKYKDLISNESMLEFMDKMRQEDITPEMLTDLFESIIKFKSSLKNNK